ALYPQGALKRSESSTTTSVAAAHAALQPLSAGAAPVASATEVPQTGSAGETGAVETGGESNSR
ncbi:MAG: hypothetical protein ACRDLV_01040, partial [Solirubrobacteraceae bacterium]